MQSMSGLAISTATVVGKRNRIISFITNYCSWKYLNLFGAIASLALWGVATFTGWINSVAFVSHISMLALVISFIAAWRADTYTPPPGEENEN